MTPTRMPTTIVVTAVLALTLSACGEQPGDERGQQGEIDRLEAELAEASTTISEQQRELEKQQATIDRLRGEQGDAEGQEGQSQDSPASPRTAAGLVEQLHTYFPPDEQPEGWEPDSTDWRSIEVPEGFAEADSPGYDSPGRLLAALVDQASADQLGRDLWEVLARVLVEQDDAAVGAILEWGLADDAVAGVDTRLQLRAADAGWYVESAEQRSHCRRGSDGERCA